jgi:hypothetical protein
VPGILLLLAVHKQLLGHGRHHSETLLTRHAAEQRTRNANPYIPNFLSHCTQIAAVNDPQPHWVAAVIQRTHYNCFTAANAAANANDDEPTEYSP